VSFSSTPDGAAVFDAAGKQLGTTPFSAKVKPNPKVPEMRVTFRHAGYEAAVAKVKVAEGASVSVTMKVKPKTTQPPAGDLINPFGK
jgi:hypothetical protein